MALLLNSNIEALVKSHIVGRVARVGGSVNQLLTYRNCRVEDFNLVDGGYGEVQNFKCARTFMQKVQVTRRYLSQELHFLRRGHAVSRDRKTIPIDMHDTSALQKLTGRYDAIVSSNMIEHSPNPIRLLLNFHRVTGQNGFQYHAIPHYKYTFDAYRTPTSLEHMVGDFLRQTDSTDTSHNEDYIQSAIEKHGWQRSFHENYPVSYPYMHFHVFDENNLRQLFEFMFEGVVNDVLKTAEFSDNVVFFKNKLNQNFVRQFQQLINC